MGGGDSTFSLYSIGIKKSFFLTNFPENRQFKSQREDKFSYLAIIKNEVVGTTQNVTAMHIKANVFVTNYDGCEFFMKV